MDMINILSGVHSWEPGMEIKAENSSVADEEDRQSELKRMPTVYQDFKKTSDEQEGQSPAKKKQQKDLPPTTKLISIPREVEGEKPYYHMVYVHKERHQRAHQDECMTVCDQYLELCKNAAKYFNIRGRKEGSHDRPMSWEMNEQFQKLLDAPITTRSTTQFWDTRMRLWKEFQKVAMPMAHAAFGKSNFMYKRIAKDYDWRPRIWNMFNEYAPDKIDQVNPVMEKVNGNEEMFLHAMINKYGPEPPMTELILDMQNTRTAMTSNRSMKERIFCMLKEYQPNKADSIDAFMAKYKGKEKKLLEALVDKHGPEPPLPPPPATPPHAVKPVLGTTDSFSNENGAFVHVWTCNAEARKFTTAFQRLWQAVFDNFLEGLTCPYTVMCSVQGVYVTITPVVPLVTKHGNHPVDVDVSPILREQIFVIENQYDRLRGEQTTGGAASSPRLPTPIVTEQGGDQEGGLDGEEATTAVPQFRSTLAESVFKGQDGRRYIMNPMSLIETFDEEVKKNSGEPVPEEEGGAMDEVPPMHEGETNHLVEGCTWGHGGSEIAQIVRLELLPIRKKLSPEDSSVTSWHQLIQRQVPVCVALLNKEISPLVQKMQKKDSVPEQNGIVDQVLKSGTIPKLIHACGVNIKFLYFILKTVEESAKPTLNLVQQIIVRSIKHEMVHRSIKEIIRGEMDYRGHEPLLEPKKEAIEKYRADILNRSISCLVLKPIMWERCTLPVLRSKFVGTPEDFSFQQSDVKQSIITAMLTSRLQCEYNSEAKRFSNLGSSVLHSSFFVPSGATRFTLRGQTKESTTHVAKVFEQVKTEFESLMSPKAAGDDAFCSPTARNQISPTPDSTQQDNTSFTNAVNSSFVSRRGTLFGSRNTKPPLEFLQRKLAAALRGVLVAAVVSGIPLIKSILEYFEGAMGGLQQIEFQKRKSVLLLSSPSFVRKASSASFYASSPKSRRSTVLPPATSPQGNTTLVDFGVPNVSITLSPTAAEGALDSTQRRSRSKSVRFLDTKTIGTELEGDVLSGSLVEADDGGDGGGDFSPLYINNSSIVSPTGGQMTLNASFSQVALNDSLVMDYDSDGARSPSSLDSPMAANMNAPQQRIYLYDLTHWNLLLLLYVWTTFVGKEQEAYPKKILACVPVVTAYLDLLANNGEEEVVMYDRLATAKNRAAKMKIAEKRRDVEEGTDAIIGHSEGEESNKGNEEQKLTEPRENDAVSREITFEAEYANSEDGQGDSNDEEEEEEDNIVINPFESTLVVIGRWRIVSAIQSAKEKNEMRRVSVDLIDAVINDRDVDGTLGANFRYNSMIAAAGHMYSDPAKLEERLMGYKGWMRTAQDAVSMKVQEERKQQEIESYLKIAGSAVMTPELQGNETLRDFSMGCVDLVTNTMGKDHDQSTTMVTYASYYVLGFAKDRIPDGSRELVAIYRENCIRLHLENPKGKIKMFKSDWYVARIVDIIDVLKEIGEWPCAEMLTFHNAAVAAKTKSKAGQRKAAMAVREMMHQSGATQKLQRMIRGRAMRKGTKFVEFMESVHRQGVSFLEWEGRREVPRLRMAALRLNIKQSYAKTILELLEVGLEEMKRRLAILREEDNDSTLMFIDEVSVQQKKEISEEGLYILWTLRVEVFEGYKRLVVQDYEALERGIIMTEIEKFQGAMIETIAMSTIETLFIEELLEFEGICRLSVEVWDYGLGWQMGMACPTQESLHRHMSVQHEECQWLSGPIERRGRHEVFHDQRVAWLKLASVTLQSLVREAIEKEEEVGFQNLLESGDSEMKQRNAMLLLLIKTEETRRKVTSQYEDTLRQVVAEMEEELRGKLQLFLLLHLRLLSVQCAEEIERCKMNDEQGRCAAQINQECGGVTEFTLRERKILRQEKLLRNVAVRDWFTGYLFALLRRETAERSAIRLEVDGIQVAWMQRAEAYRRNTLRTELDVITPCFPFMKELERLRRLELEEEYAKDRRQITVRLFQLDRIAMNTHQNKLIEQLRVIYKEGSARIRLRDERVWDMTLFVYLGERSYRRRLEKVEEYQVRVFYNRLEQVHRKFIEAQSRQQLPLVVLRMRKMMERHVLAEYSSLMIPLTVQAEEEVRVSIEIESAQRCEGVVFTIEEGERGILCKREEEARNRVLPFQMVAIFREQVLKEEFMCRIVLKELLTIVGVEVGSRQFIEHQLEPNDRKKIYHDFEVRSQVISYTAKVRKSQMRVTSQNLLENRLQEKVEARKKRDEAAAEQQRRRIEARKKRKGTAYSAAGSNEGNFYDHPNVRNCASMDELVSLEETYRMQLMKSAQKTIRDVLVMEKAFRAGLAMRLGIPIPTKSLTNRRQRTTTTTKVTAGKVPSSYAARTHKREDSASDTLNDSLLLPADSSSFEAFWEEQMDFVADAFLSGYQTIVTQETSHRRTLRVKMIGAEVSTGYWREMRAVYNEASPPHRDDEDAAAAAATPSTATSAAPAMRNKTTVRSIHKVATEEKKTREALVSKSFTSLMHLLVRQCPWIGSAASTSTSTKNDHKSDKAELPLEEMIAEEGGKDEEEEVVKQQVVVVQLSKEYLAFIDGVKRKKGFNKDTLRGEDEAPPTKICEDVQLMMTRLKSTINARMGILQHCTGTSRSTTMALQADHPRRSENGIIVGASSCASCSGESDNVAEAGSSVSLEDAQGNPDATNNIPERVVVSASREEDDTSYRSGTVPLFGLEALDKLYEGAMWLQKMYEGMLKKEEEAETFSGGSSSSLVQIFSEWWYHYEREDCVGAAELGREQILRDASFVFGNGGFIRKEMCPNNGGEIQQVSSSLLLEHVEQTIRQQRENLYLGGYVSSVWNMRETLLKGFIPPPPLPPPPLPPPRGHDEEGDASHEDAPGTIEQTFHNPKEFPETEEGKPVEAEDDRDQGAKEGEEGNQPKPKQGEFFLIQEASVAGNSEKDQEEVAFDSCAEQFLVQEGPTREQLEGLWLRGYNQLKDSLERTNQGQEGENEGNDIQKEEEDSHQQENVQVLEELLLRSQIDADIALIISMEQYIWTNLIVVPHLLALQGDAATDILHDATQTVTECEMRISELSPKGIPSLAFVKSLLQVCFVGGRLAAVSDQEEDIHVADEAQDEVENRATLLYFLCSPARRLFLLSLPSVPDACGDEEEKSQEGRSYPPLHALSLNRVGDDPGEKAQSFSSSLLLEEEEQTIRDALMDDFLHTMLWGTDGYAGALVEGERARRLEILQEAHTERVETLQEPFLKGFLQVLLYDSSCGAETEGQEEQADDVEVLLQKKEEQRREALMAAWQNEEVHPIAPTRKCEDDNRNMTDDDERRIVLHEATKRWGRAVVGHGAEDALIVCDCVDLAKSRLQRIETERRQQLSADLLAKQRQVMDRYLDSILGAVEHQVNTVIFLDSKTGLPTFAPLECEEAEARHMNIVLWEFRARRDLLLKHNFLVSVLTGTAMKSLDQEEEPRMIEEELPQKSMSADQEGSNGTSAEDKPREKTIEELLLECVQEERSIRIREVSNSLNAIEDTIARCVNQIVLAQRREEQEHREILRDPHSYVTGLERDGRNAVLETQVKEVVKITRALSAAVVDAGAAHSSIAVLERHLLFAERVMLIVDEEATERRLLELGGCGHLFYERVERNMLRDRYWKKVFPPPLPPPPPPLDENEGAVEENSPEHEADNVGIPRSQFPFTSLSFTVDELRGGDLSLREKEQQALPQFITGRNTLCSRYVDRRRYNRQHALEEAAKRRSEATFRGSMIRCIRSCFFGIIQVEAEERLALYNLFAGGNFNRCAQWCLDEAGGDDEHSGEVAADDTEGAATHTETKERSNSSIFAAQLKIATTPKNLMEELKCLTDPDLFIAEREAGTRRVIMQTIRQFYLSNPMYIALPGNIYSVMNGVIAFQFASAWNVKEGEDEGQEGRDDCGKVLRDSISSSVLSDYDNIFVEAAEVLKRQSIVQCEGVAFQRLVDERRVDSFIRQLGHARNHNRFVERLCSTLRLRVHFRRSSRILDSSENDARMDILSEEFSEREAVLGQEVQHIDKRRINEQNIVEDLLVMSQGLVALEISESTKRREIETECFDVNVIVLEMLHGQTMMKIHDAQRVENLIKKRSISNKSTTGNDGAEQQEVIDLEDEDIEWMVNEAVLKEQEQGHKDRDWAGSSSSQQQDDDHHQNNNRSTLLSGLFRTALQEEFHRYLIETDFACCVRETVCALLGSKMTELSTLDGPLQAALVRYRAKRASLQFHEAAAHQQQEGHTTNDGSLKEAIMEDDWKGVLRPLDASEEEDTVMVESIGGDSEDPIKLSAATTGPSSSASFKPRRRVKLATLLDEITYKTHGSGPLIKLEAGQRRSLIHKLLTGLRQQLHLVGQFMNWLQRRECRSAERCSFVCKKYGLSFAMIPAGSPLLSARTLEELRACEVEMRNTISERGLRQLKELHVKEFSFRSIRQTAMLTISSSVESPRARHEKGSPRGARRKFAALAKLRTSGTSLSPRNDVPSSPTQKVSSPTVRRKQKGGDMDYNTPAVYNANSSKVSEDQHRYQQQISDEDIDDEDSNPLRSVGSISELRKSTSLRLLSPSRSTVLSDADVQLPPYFLLLFAEEQDERDSIHLCEQSSSSLLTSMAKALVLVDASQVGFDLFDPFEHLCSQEAHLRFTLEKGFQRNLEELHVEAKLHKKDVQQLSRPTDSGDKQPTLKKLSSLKSNTKGSRQSSDTSSKREVKTVALQLEHHTWRRNHLLKTEKSGREEIEENCVKILISLTRKERVLRAVVPSSSSSSLLAGVGPANNNSVVLEEGSQQDDIVTKRRFGQLPPLSESNTTGHPKGRERRRSASLTEETREDASMEILAQKDLIGAEKRKRHTVQRSLLMILNEIASTLHHNPSTALRGEVHAKARRRVHDLLSYLLESSATEQQSLMLKPSSHRISLSRLYGELNEGKGGDVGKEEGDSEGPLRAFLIDHERPGREELLRMEATEREVLFSLIHTTVKEVKRMNTGSTPLSTVGTKSSAKHKTKAPYAAMLLKRMGNTQRSSSSGRPHQQNHRSFSVGDNEVLPARLPSLGKDTRPVGPLTPPPLQANHQHHLGVTASKTPQPSVGTTLAILKGKQLLEKLRRECQDEQRKGARYVQKQRM